MAIVSSDLKITGLVIAEASYVLVCHKIHKFFVELLGSRVQQAVSTLVSSKDFLGIVRGNRCASLDSQRLGASIFAIYYS